MRLVVFVLLWVEVAGVTPTPSLTVSETVGTGTVTMTESETTPTETGTGTASAAMRTGTETGTATATMRTKTETVSASGTMRTRTGTATGTTTMRTGTGSMTGTETVSASNTMRTETETGTVTTTMRTETGSMTETETVSASRTMKTGTETGTVTATMRTGTVSVSGTGTGTATMRTETETVSASGTTTMQTETGTRTVSVSGTVRTGTGTKTMRTETETVTRTRRTATMTKKLRTKTMTSSATETETVRTGTETGTMGTGTGTMSVTMRTQTGTGTMQTKTVTGSVSVSATGTPSASETMTGSATVRTPSLTRSGTASATKQTATKTSSTTETPSATAIVTQTASSTQTATLPTPTASRSDTYVTVTSTPTASVLVSGTATSTMRTATLSDVQTPTVSIPLTVLTSRRVVLAFDMLLESWSTPKEAEVVANIRGAIPVEQDVGVRIYTVASGSVLATVGFESSAATQGRLDDLAGLLIVAANDDSSALHNNDGTLLHGYYSGDDPPSSGGGGGLSGGEIAGIVIAVVLVLCICIVLLWLKLRRKNTSTPKPPPHTDVDYKAALETRFGSVCRAVDFAQTTPDDTVKLKSIAAMFGETSLAAQTDVIMANLGLTGGSDVPRAYLSQTLGRGDPLVAKMEDLRGLFRQTSSNTDTATGSSLKDAIQEVEDVQWATSLSGTRHNWASPVLAQLDTLPEVTYVQFHDMCYGPLKDVYRGTPSASSPVGDQPRAARVNPLQNLLDEAAPISQPDFTPGDEIDALYDGTWYQAVITEIHSSGYNVRWDDGIEMLVSPVMVRTRATSPPQYLDGDHVEVHWFDGEWHPGTIQGHPASDGTYTILWVDGQISPGIVDSDIRASTPVDRELSPKIQARCGSCGTILEHEPGKEVVCAQCQATVSFHEVDLHDMPQR